MDLEMSYDPPLPANETQKAPQRPFGKEPCRSAWRVEPLAKAPASRSKLDAHTLELHVPPVGPG
jgi:hypothetical protein